MYRWNKGRFNHQVHRAAVLPVRLHAILAFCILTGHHTTRMPGKQIVQPEPGRTPQHQQQEQEAGDQFRYDPFFMHGVFETLLQN